MAIFFYSQTEEYSEFSNFAPYGVEMGDAWWPTVEHYFQAQKFNDAAYKERIRRARRPKDAKSLGRTRAIPIRKDWDEARLMVMYEAVRKKFETHPHPRQLLLATGQQELIENAPMDGFWGCGPDGAGNNHLGKILMRVRAELGQEEG